MSWCTRTLPLIQKLLQIKLDLKLCQFQFLLEVLSTVIYPVIQPLHQSLNQLGKGGKVEVLTCKTVLNKQKTQTKEVKMVVVVWRTVTPWNKTSKPRTYKNDWETQNIIRRHHQNGGGNEILLRACSFRTPYLSSDIAFLKSTSGSSEMSICISSRRAQRQVTSSDKHAFSTWSMAKQNGPSPFMKSRGSGSGR